MPVHLLRGKGKEDRKIKLTEGVLQISNAQSTFIFDLFIIPHRLLTVV